MNKRGLSEVITSVIMVLLVLIAITIVWIVVKNALNIHTEQSTIDKINVRLKIEKVVIGENQINITLKRSAGSGKFSGIKFVFTDGINSEIIALDETLRQLEEKMFTLTLTELEVSNITEISVVPVLTTPSGKKLDGLENNYVVRVVPGIVEDGGEENGESEKTCSEQNGNICSSDEDCYGNWILSSDSSRCCGGTCEMPTTLEEISPFGIMAAFALSTLTTINATDKVAWAGEHFRNLGAKWSRSVGETIIWVIIEPEIGKGYDWSNSDEVLKKAYENGGENFNMVVVISPQRFKGDNPDILSDEENYYSKFVEELVERYDGDGINDYDSIIKVKYWQMENEPFPTQWENRGGTIDGYVRFTELTHNAIKKSDPNAKIILGTVQFETTEDINKFNEVISKMKNKTLFDYVDTHYWGAGNNYKIPISDARSVLDSNGYSNAKMVALEFGTTVTLKGKTEKDQANYLIKGYAYNIAHEFALINWNNLVEWKDFGRSGSIYNYLGLIADGENEDPVPAGTPRLAYYSYKKMTEKLDGSNWSNIQKINESNGIYVYKFTKNNKPIWVAWNDNTNNVDVTIFGINSNSVNITEAIPNYEYGKNVTNYNTAFYNYTKIVSGNKVVITLEDAPVFVEEN